MPSHECPLAHEIGGRCLSSPSSREEAPLAGAHDEESGWGREGHDPSQGVLACKRMEIGRQRSGGVDSRAPRLAREPSCHHYPTSMQQRRRERDRERENNGEKKGVDYVEVHIVDVAREIVRRVRGASACGMCGTRASRCTEAVARAAMKNLEDLVGVRSALTG